MFEQQLKLQKEEHDIRIKYLSEEHEKKIQIIFEEHEAKMTLLQYNFGNEELSLPNKSYSRL